MTEGTNSRLGRILLVLLALCGSALIAAAWWYYLGQREALESSVSRELAAIAEVKANQVANWRRERLGDGSMLASMPVLTIARRVLSRSTVSAPDRTALLDVLQRAVSAFHYAGAALVDVDGQPRVEINTAHSDPVRFRALQAAAAGKVTLSELYRDSRSGQPRMSVTIPVQSSGAIILDIDPANFLYPFIQSWPTASRTGETLLVRRDGPDRILYLNELRHMPGKALERYRSLRGIPLPDDSAYRNGYPFKWTDYRGVSTMLVIHEVPGSEWFLIAKMDAAEVNEPMRRLGWEMALVIALIAAVNASAAGLVWRNRQLRIYRDREAWFRQIANDTPAYLWTTSTTEENSFINQQLSRFLGTDETRLKLGWIHFLHPEDRERVRALFVKCLEARGEYRDEFRVRRFDGSYRWVVAHALPRYGGDDGFAGYAGALIDITERRDAEQKLRDTNQALATELRERTRSQQEVHALTARLINAQEEERARLARELHDDLSQQIAAVSIATSSLKKQIPPESLEALAQSGRIQQKLVNLAQYVRRLSHELHPAVLEHSGLAAALRSYCSEFATLTSHRIAFRVEGSCDGLAAPVALCVYRVAQEALQNSIKHARVDEAEVVLTCAGGMLCLVVSDRGVGMDTQEKAGGLGLVSIKERTRLVNGTVEVKSERGAGTSLTLKILVPSGN